MKRCVITGAASGIGAALAKRFAAQGCEVIGIDRDRAKAARLKAELAAGRFILAELSSGAGLDRVAAELGTAPIDLLIHSAGINAVGAFEGADMHTQCAVIDVNMRAPIQLTRALLKRGALQRGSAVVFISSLSHFVGYPGAAVYAASKDGLAAYARNLGVALKPEGIHVMSVFPGPTRTPHAAEHSPNNREAKRMLPEVLAAKLEKALRQKRHYYVPGVSNKVFAFLGLWLPGLTERIMLKTLFAKLP